MLLKDSFVDVATTSGSMRIYTFSPVISNKPKAKFPGVLVFAEIYQVTPAVARFCRDIAGQGYIVACPSSFHEFEGHRAMEYNEQDTKLGNDYKIRKTLEAYDEDCDVSIKYLQGLDACTGALGATGICLGGHLAFRAALHPAIGATVTFFGTDIHSSTLSSTPTDSLDRALEIKGEMVLIFGKEDNHVPRDGRTLIRETLDDAGVRFSWIELAWAQHAFVRDESSKGRYDPAITAVMLAMMMECFSRVLFH